MNYLTFCQAMVDQTILRNRNLSQCTVRNFDPRFAAASGLSHRRHMRENLKAPSGRSCEHRVIPIILSSL